MVVASKSLLRRVTAALGALDIADGPISRLDAARRLREAAEDLEAAQIEAARKAGATWSEIGACYGLTKQGAQQRFRAARRQAQAAPAPPEGAKGDGGGNHGPFGQKEFQLFRTGRGATARAGACGA